MAEEKKGDRQDKVKLSSLDEQFDANMRYILAGPQTGREVDSSAPGGESRLLELLKSRYGLESLDEMSLKDTDLGGIKGFFRNLGRKLFITRGYHSLILTILRLESERSTLLEARFQEMVERFNEMIVSQRNLNERIAKTIFQLWGDYNHLVNVVLDHQINVVTKGLVEGLRETQKDITQKIEGLTEDVRKTQGGITEKVESLTGDLREIKAEVNRIAIPHDEMQRSISDLLKITVRNDLFIQKLEKLALEVEELKKKNS